MRARRPECPKCRGSMEAGFVADCGYGEVKQSTWVDGEPVRSVWAGLKMRAATSTR